MKVSQSFAKTSFLIICTVVVSFSFVKEFGIENADHGKSSIPVKIENDSINGRNNKSMVIVKFFDRQDSLVYKKVIDLREKRKMDAKLHKYLSTSKLIRKVNNELFFRIN